VLNLLKGKEASIILDIGCGSNKTIPSAIGIDIRPVADVISSGDTIPFPDNYADIIISRHSFEHLLNPIATLKEWHRVLKPEGEIFFILPDHEYLNTMQFLCSGEQHLHAYTRRSFSDLINASRLFHVEQIEDVIKEWSFGGILKKADCMPPWQRL
jgi:predicted SAM-dependent methyltransferase